MSHHASNPFTNTAVLLALALSLAGLGTARADAPPAPPAAPLAPATREVEIIVDGRYKPSRVEVVEGELVRLKFVRKDYSGCTKEVVFPKLGIKRELPTNKPVLIELPALAPGEYEFKCGMNMVKGLLVVKPRPH